MSGSLGVVPTSRRKTEDPEERAVEAVFGLELSSESINRTSTADLREMRGRFHAGMTALLRRSKEAKRDFTEEEQLAWDVAERVVEGVDSEIERRAKGGRGVFDPRSQYRAAAPVREGDVVLSKDQSVADWMRAHGYGATSHELEQAGDEAGLGGYLRALAVGPKSEAERALFEKRAMSEGTGSAGGFTVPTLLLGNFIDALRAAAVSFRAGASTVMLETATTNLARLAGEPTVAWKAENASISPSDATFAQVSFVARTLCALSLCSNELLQDSVNIREILERSFTQSMALELDRVALYGSGTAPQPRGIKNTAGIGSNSLGAGNGAAPASWSEILTCVGTLLGANAAFPTAAVMNPRTFIEYGKLADTTTQPMRKPDLIADLPLLPTTSIPINETEGTSNVASTLLIGNFAELLIGMRLEAQVVILKERYADFNQTGFLGILRADVQVAHAASFCQLKGIL